MLGGCVGGERGGTSRSEKRSGGPEENGGEEVLSNDGDSRLCGSDGL